MDLDIHVCRSESVSSGGVGNIDVVHADFVRIACAESQNDSANTTIFYHPALTTNSAAH